MEHANKYIKKMIWYMIGYDMIWYTIRNDIWYDIIWYDIYDMIYLITAFVLTPGGSSTQTVHRTTHWNTIPRTGHT